MTASTTAPQVRHIPLATPFQDQKPGTSGLRRPHSCVSAETLPGKLP